MTSPSETLKWFITGNTQSKTDRQRAGLIWKMAQTVAGQNWHCSVAQMSTEMCYFTGFTQHQAWLVVEWVTT